MLRCDVTCHTVLHRMSVRSLLGRNRGASHPARATWNGWGDPARRPGLTAPVREFLDQRFRGLARRARRRPWRWRTSARTVRAGPASCATGSTRIATVSDDAEARVAHARGKSYRDLVRIRSGDACGAPDAVVLRDPARRRSRSCCGCARRSGIAVVPFGGGTSVVGGVEPLRGGSRRVIALDLAGLDRLVNLDIVSHTATLQPGLRGPAGGGAARRPRLHAGPFPAVLRAGDDRRLRGDALGRSGVHRLRPQRRTGRRPHRRDPGGHPAPRPRAAQRRRARPAPAHARQRGRVRGHHRRHDVGAARPRADKRYEAWFFPTFAAGLDALRRLEQHRLAPEVSRLSDEDETDGQPRAVRSRRRRSPALYLKARRARAMAIFGWEGEPELVSARRKLGLKIIRDAGGVAAGHERGHGLGGRPLRRPVPAR